MLFGSDRDRKNIVILPQRCIFNVRIILITRVRVHPPGSMRLWVRYLCSPIVIVRNSFTSLHEAVLYYWGCKKMTSSPILHRCCGDNQVIDRDAHAPSKDVSRSVSVESGDVVPPGSCSFLVPSAGLSRKKVS